MSWFANQKTAIKLFAGFGLCLLAAMLIGAVSLARMAQMNAAASSVATDALPSAIDLGRLVDDVKQFRLYEFNHILATDKARMDAIEAQMQARNSEIEADFAHYEKTINQEEDRNHFAELKAHWANYLTEH